MLMLKPRTCWEQAGAVADHEGIDVDIVEFLRARLDEDEATARLAPTGPWEAVGNRDDSDDDDLITSWAVLGDREDDLPSGFVTYGMAFESNALRAAPATVSSPPIEWVPDERVQLAAEHIARHDPARVLRDVEAKRRIIALWERSEFCERIALDDVLDLLALPYADHPNFRQEWREENWANQ